MPGHVARLPTASPPQPRATSGVNVDPDVSVHGRPPCSWGLLLATPALPRTRGIARCQRLRARSARWPCAQPDTSRGRSTRLEGAGGEAPRKQGVARRKPSSPNLPRPALRNTIRHLRARPEHPCARSIGPTGPRPPGRILQPPRSDDRRRRGQGSHMPGRHLPMMPIRFKKVATTIKRYLEGVVAIVATGLHNGRTEGLNGKTRVITPRASGFHSASAPLIRIFLCCFGSRSAAGFQDSRCPPHDVRSARILPPHKAATSPPSQSRQPTEIT